MQSKQEEDILCIMGDFNEEIGINQDLMATICRNHNVYNVLLNVFFLKTRTLPHTTEGKQLDYILYSQNVHKPEKTGHNQYNYLYHSNHIATFINLPMTETFSMSQSIVSPELRSIHSNSNDIKLFINNIINHLHEYNIFN